MLQQRLTEKPRVSRLALVWIIGGSMARWLRRAAAGIIHYQRAEEVRADQETPEDFEPSVTPPAAANADQSAVKLPRSTHRSRFPLPRQHLGE